MKGMQKPERGRKRRERSLRAHGEKRGERNRRLLFAAVCLCSDNNQGSRPRAIDCHAANWIDRKAYLDRRRRINDDEISFLPLKKTVSSSSLTQRKKQRKIEDDVLQNKFLEKCVDA